MNLTAVTERNATLGTFVVRGKDWCYDEQDYVDGQEVTGEIIKTAGDSIPDWGDEEVEEGWVLVVWNDGGRLPTELSSYNTYKIGLGGQYDLALWSPECDLEEEIEI